MRLESTQPEAGDEVRAAAGRLRARLAELTARLHGIEGELDSHHDPDWADLATQREDDEVLERLGEAGLREVAGIRAALRRIADGSYGTCARCGSDIGAERLRALPATPLCRECAT